MERIDSHALAFKKFGRCTMEGFQDRRVLSKQTPPSTTAIAVKNRTCGKPEEAAVPHNRKTLKRRTEGGLHGIRGMHAPGSAT